MNDLGPARPFLGLEMENLPNRPLCLHQRQFIEKVLHRFNMEQCNGTYTPMETGQQLLPVQRSDTLVDPRKYQSLVGSFISKNNTLRQGRPMRLAHLAHITSIANQDATSI